METAWPTYAGYDPGTWWGYYARYGEHGDAFVASTGTPGPVLFKDNFPAEINTTHEWEICVRGDTVERFKDGVSLGVKPLPAGWHRPTHIAMGNPNSPGPSWTSHETNAIEVRSLQTVPSAGLVGYWNFNNCTAADSSGMGNNGTLVGSPICVAGASGSGLQLNSTNYAQIPDSTSLDVSSAFTISTWFKADGLDRKSVV
jgi:hypothetical protein